MFPLAKCHAKSHPMMSHVSVFLCSKIKATPPFSLPISLGPALLPLRQAQGCGVMGM